MRDHIATAAGRRTGRDRLATTLLDHHRWSASALVTLYHERWEIEPVYLELKSSILGGRILRARTPADIAQEIYALLATYQILRIAITDAIDTHGGVDPDRGKLHHRPVRRPRPAIQAAGVIAETVIDLVGAICTRVLNNLPGTRDVG